MTSVKACRGSSPAAASTTSWATSPNVPRSAAGGRGTAHVGDQSVGGRPMAQDSLFRIASITKPMMTALALTFVAPPRALTSITASPARIT